MNAPTIARAHLPDPVALALEAMTPEQFGQSMGRWVEHGRPLSGEALAYIAAIYREIPA